MNLSKVVKGLSIKKQRSRRGCMNLDVHCNTYFVCLWRKVSTQLSDLKLSSLEDVSSHMLINTW